MLSKRAKRVIQFIETLTYPDGLLAGQKFRLDDWQAEIIEKTYGPSDSSGERLATQSVLTMGRKNGKTSLVAGLTLCHLCGPEAVKNGQLYSVAKDRDQAAIIHKFAAAMVYADEELAEALTVIESRRVIKHPDSGSVYKALSSESKTKHGMSSSFIVFDELAQFAADRTLYDVMMTSRGAHGGQALVWVISTQAADDLAILSELIDYGRRVNEGEIDDPSFKCFIYETNIEDDPWNEKLWYNANPGLGKFRSLKEMREVADKAKRMPTGEASFRNLYLNQRINTTVHAISRTSWKDCGGTVDDDLFYEADVYGGLDLSAKNDLTAFVLVARDADGRAHVKNYFWKPADTLKEHEERDRVPYQTWVKQGLLLTTPGKTVSYRWVAKQIAEVCSEYNVKRIWFDRWRIADLLDAFEQEGISASEPDEDGNSQGGICFVPCGQGFKEMTPCVEALEDAITDQKLCHGGNPVLTWNATNVVTVKDPAGSRKFAKDKSTGRIDGIVALSMALRGSSLATSTGEAKKEYQMMFV